MMEYYLADLNSVDKLVGICNKFKEDIDIKFENRIVDGKSGLGVALLIGHTVNIIINTYYIEEKEILFRNLLNGEVKTNDKYVDSARSAR